MEEILEITPHQIEFDYKKREQSISIQNLTLHYIQVRILSPNPTLYTLIPNIFSIEPCTTTDVTVKINLNIKMNMFSLIMNKKLVIFFYDIDEVEEIGDMDWNKLPIDLLGRRDIHINYQNKSTFYQIHTNEKEQKFMENVQILQALFIKQKTPLNDEYKKILINKYLEMFSKYQTYKIMEDSIAFIGNQLDAENEIFCLESNGQLFYIASYKPPFISHQQPQHPIEPLSPQQQKKQIEPIKTIKKDKSSEQLLQKEPSPIKQFFSAFVGRKPEEPQEVTLINSTPVQTVEIPQYQQETVQKQEIQEQVIKIEKPTTLEASLPEYSRPSRRLNNEQSSLTDDVRKSSHRQHQRSVSIDERKIQVEKVNESDMAWDKRAKYQQEQKVAALVVMKEKDMYKYIIIQPSQSQQASYRVNEVAQLKTYQQIVDVLIFRDGKYLITVGEKQDIKVWQLSIRGLVGTIKELENKKEKRILLIQEWRYVSPTADENYEFEIKDPKNGDKHQELYTPYETAYRFVTGSEDQIFRIFNLTTMTLEQQFSCRLQIPTSLTFMPDRGLFCIGGQPYKTIFGQTRKYRSIRFFCMNNLLEKPKYKVFCKHEDDFLNKIIYSENPIYEHYHARINNILAIQIYRRNSSGKHIVQSDRILFIFLDRMNQCTVLMTLECESLNIRGINNLIYLYKEGVFAVLEANDVVTIKNAKVEQITQKVVLVNLKQLQTSQGVESGIEYNLIQEQRSKANQLQIQILANPTLMVIPQFKSLTLQNLKGEDQIVHLLDMGDPKATHNFNILISVNNFIVSIIDDIAQVISVN